MGTARTRENTKRENGKKRRQRTREREKQITRVNEEPGENDNTIKGEQEKT